MLRAKTTMTQSWEFDSQPAPAQSLQKEETSLNFIPLKHFIFIHVYTHMPAHLPTPHVFGVLGGQKGAAHPLKPELQAVVNCLVVSVENQTLVLSKGNRALSRSTPFPAPLLFHTLIVLIPSKAMALYGDMILCPTNMWIPGDFLLWLSQLGNGTGI